jgi:hypothetical protein
VLLKKETLFSKKKFISSEKGGEEKIINSSNILMKDKKWQ